MPNPPHPFARLLQEDRRYRADAYFFVFEALEFAQRELGLGTHQPSEPEDPPPKARKGKENEPESPEKHLTGQQLCEAIRVYALEQYGYMAKCVLNSWGVYTTSDFGEIVYNLIKIGKMRKTKEDRREDFDNVFDFETGLKQSFRITRPA